MIENSTKFNKISNRKRRKPPIHLTTYRGWEYSWLRRWIKIQCDKFVAMMIYYFFSTVAAAAVLLFTGGIPVLNAAQIPGILWTGVLIYGVAFSLWSIAIASGNTAKISNLAYLTPFVSLIWIYFLLGEPITMASVVGLLIIVAGVILQMFDKK